MSGVDLGVEEPWELPEGWTWTTVDHVTEKVATIDPRRSLTDDTFDYVDLGAIGPTGFIEPTRLLGRDAPTRARQLIAPGDTLYSCVRVYLGNIVFFASGVENSVASTAFCVLRPTEAIDPRFLHHFVRSDRFRQWMIPLQRGNSPPAVVDSDVKSQLLPLPPLAEQRRIVARIDALFAEIAEGEAALARARAGLETFRRALLKAAVTGELTREWREANLLQPGDETGHELLVRLCEERTPLGPKGRGKRSAAAALLDPSSLPDLPEGWAWRRLGEIAWASSYGTSVKCNTASIGAPVLRIPNIQAGEIVACDMKYATADLGLDLDDHLMPGDFLVVRTNGSKDLIGRGGILCYPLPNLTYFASYLIRFRLIGDETIWRWIAAVFESPSVRTWMTGQIASSAGQYNVSQTSLSTLPVPIPPPGETAEILRRVSDALSAHADTLALLDAEAADAARLRQAVLKAAFEGRLVAQDPTDEPARAMLERLAANPAATAQRRRGRPKRTER